jgi:anthranilate phosphoribosyltransferase
MKQILNKLFDHQQLTKEEARQVLTNISNEAYNSAQIASFVTVYLMRGISVEELKGFKEALLELAISFDVRGQDTIDLCGTGGDGKNTFNISTLASFVVAGAGFKVVKHGNYGVSSISGSSNVIESFGYKFTTDETKLLRQLDKSNICFCHAPLFHPALKGVGPIRRELGVKTFFNMLGPLVNPAQPNHQLVGVFSLKLAKLYKYLHEEMDKKYKIVHSLDGYDEISLTSDAQIISNNTDLILSPEDFGMNILEQSNIYGGTTIEKAAEIFKSVLENKSSNAQKNVVAVNAALAIQCFKQDMSLVDCTHMALESIESGKALNSFQSLLN